jgi:hypothetical protein
MESVIMGLVILGMAALAYVCTIVSQVFVIGITQMNNKEGV